MLCPLGRQRRQVRGLPESRAVASCRASASSLRPLCLGLFWGVLSCPFLSLPLWRQLFWGPILFLVHQGDISHPGPRSPGLSALRPCGAAGGGSSGSCWFLPSRPCTGWDGDWVLAFCPVGWVGAFLPHFSLCPSRAASALFGGSLALSLPVLPPWTPGERSISMGEAKLAEMQRVRMNYSVSLGLT